MARSAKTKHVMNLVGPAKKPSVRPARLAAAEMAEKAPHVPKLPELQEVPQPVPNISPQLMPQAEAEHQADTMQENPPDAKKIVEEKEPENKITAIVCELINQELGSVAQRFRLKLTDSNLWELTRAALEDVRPEFSSDSKETEKKLERLRPQVIAAMTKAAIKVKSKEQ